MLFDGIPEARRQRFDTYALEQPLPTSTPPAPNSPSPSISASSASGVRPVSPSSISRARSPCEDGHDASSIIAANNTSSSSVGNNVNNAAHKVSVYKSNQHDTDLRNKLAAAWTAKHGLDLVVFVKCIAPREDVLREFKGKPIACFADGLANMRMHSMVVTSMSPLLQHTLRGLRAMNRVAASSTNQALNNNLSSLLAAQKSKLKTKSILPDGAEMVDKQIMQESGLTPTFEGISCFSLDSAHVEGMAFFRAINFIYTGSLALSDANVSETLRACHFLGLQGGVDLCVEYLLQKLQPCNALRICALGNLFDCGRLEELADEYLSDHFMQVTQETEWLELASDAVERLLRRDNLKCSSEASVVRALVRWASYTPVDTLKPVSADRDNNNGTDSTDGDMTGGNKALASSTSSSSKKRTKRPLSSGSSKRNRPSSSNSPTGESHDAEDPNASLVNGESEKDEETGSVSATTAAGAVATADGSTDAFKLDQEQQAEDKKANLFKEDDDENENGQDADDEEEDDDDDDLDDDDDDDDDDEEEEEDRKKAFARILENGSIRFAHLSDEEIEHLNQELEDTPDLLEIWKRTIGWEKVKRERRAERIARVQVADDDVQAPVMNGSGMAHNGETGIANDDAMDTTNNDDEDDDDDAETAGEENDADDDDDDDHAIPNLRRYEMARGSQVKDDKCEFLLEGHGGYVYAVTESPSGNLVSGSRDQTIRVWPQPACEHKPGTELVLEGHSERVFGLLTLSNGKVASCSFDQTIRIWNSETWVCEHVLEGHTGWVVAIAEVAGCLVSGSADNTIKVWNIDTWQCERTLTGHTDHVYGVCRVTVRHKGRTCDLLATGSQDATVKLWNPRRNWRLIKTLRGHRSSIRSIKQVGNFLATASADRTIRLWHLRDHVFCKPAGKLIGHSDVVETLVCIPGPDGGKPLVGSASRDNCIKIWNTETKLCVKTLVGHRSWVKSLFVLSSGKLASASADKTVRVWDLSE